MRIGKDYDVKGQVCPTCGKVMDAVSGLDHDSAPKPGDVALCFGCGALSLFTETIALRTPDPMELLKVELSDQWPEIERAQAAIRKLRPRVKR